MKQMLLFSILYVVGVSKENLCWFCLPCFIQVCFTMDNQIFHKFSEEVVIFFSYLQVRKTKLLLLNNDESGLNQTNIANIFRSILSSEELYRKPYKKRVLATNHCKQYVLHFDRVVFLESVSIPITPKAQDVNWWRSLSANHISIPFTAANIWYDTPANL